MVPPRRGASTAKGGSVNLKELSLHLGLSQTTVSRALNGYPEVGEETRKRVMDAAGRFHYRPNANARRLATGRAGAIGIVFPVGENWLLDPHFTEFLAGIAGRGAEADTDLLVSATHETEEEGYRRLARMRSADVVILSAPLVKDSRLALLARLGLPTIVHGRTISAEPYAHLDIDNESAFRGATEHLIEGGHRRIGLINGDTRQTFATNREAGWRKALVARGVGVDERLNLSGPMTEQAGYLAARRLMEPTHRPSALLCSSMVSALGVGRALADLKLAVGRDVALVAHDDGLPFIRPESMQPALTTTFSSIRAAGKRIAEMAMALGSGESVETLQEVWHVELLVRGSSSIAK